MRNIQWHLKVDPCTFLPIYVCVVEGKDTEVHYSIEDVMDESVNVGREEIKRRVLLNLNQDMENKTDMTAEEREFALRIAFKE